MPGSDSRPRLSKGHAGTSLGQTAGRRDSRDSLVDLGPSDGEQGRSKSFSS